MNKIILIAFVLLFVFGCGSNDTSTEGAAPVEELDTLARQAGAQKSTLPQTRQDTLRIEGMAEPVELRLYESPAGLSLPFYTYLPPDMEVETGNTGRDQLIRFRMGEASLTFALMPEGTGRSAAQSRAQSALGKVNVQSCEKSYRWQWECLYAASDKGRVKRVLLGQQQGRQFYYLVDYPVEYSDGFVPRYELVLREWRFINE